MKQHNIKLFINKAVLDDEAITDNGVLTYVALSYCMQPYKVICVTTDYLCSVLFDPVSDYEKYRGISDKVTEGLYNLADNNYITIVNNFGKNAFAISCEGLHFNPQGGTSFTVVNSATINRIVQYSDSRVTKTIRFYLALAGTINSKTKVGFTSLTKLSQIARVSRSTGIRSFLWLEEQNFIVVTRSEAIFNQKLQKTITQNNLYALVNE